MRVAWATHFLMNVTPLYLAVCAFSFSSFSTTVVVSLIAVIQTTSNVLSYPSIKSCGCGILEPVVFVELIFFYAGVIDRGIPVRAELVAFVLPYVGVVDGRIRQSVVLAPFLVTHAGILGKQFKIASPPFSFHTS